jgi:hypothetical protein
MAYTFVMGSNNNNNNNNNKYTNNRTILQTANHSSEMRSHPPHPEWDVLQLQIQENGDFGKSPTWFYYATRLLQEQQFPVDYIIKTDSDTLLIPHRFFRWVQEQEEEHQQQQQQQSPTTTRTPRTRIYGGLPMDKYSCGWPHHDHCHNLTAPIYMGGALYFMSVDLAEKVAVVAPDIPHEDMAMANAIYKHPPNNNNHHHHITNFSNPEAYLNMWRHPVKDPKRMLSLWRKMLKRKRERVKNNLKQQQPNTTTM